jgi:ubiquinone/menaquinone biosynthesis methyltransferase
MISNLNFSIVPIKVFARRLFCSGKASFGFQDVPHASKKGMVREVFMSVADQYDKMNDLMSFGVHRLWKDSFVGLTAVRDAPGMRCLDVAGGTGDIAFRLMRAAKGKAEVTVADINPNMLSVGEKRAKDLGFTLLEGSPPASSSLSTTTTGSTASLAHGLRFIETDAEDMRDIPSASFDLYTIAFGIRNVTDIDRALKEAHRVLKPGGRFLCLEFSSVDNPVIAKAYDAFSFGVIPAMGEAVAKDRASYQYLVESIRRFPKAEVFGDMIAEAGLKEVTFQKWTHGVVAVHSAFKL